MPTQVSIIIATRNRAYALPECLDSVAAAIATASPTMCEIVVVDNGSTDDTPAVLKQWLSEHSSNQNFTMQILTEPLPGLSRSHNRAMRAANGNILCFTDDDCRMQADYVTTLVALFAADTEPVFRGGRVELGDPTDLPLTIFTRPTPLQWRLANNSIRQEGIAGKINGCNMAMPRSLIDRVGYFDEDLGSGAYINSAGDSDYLYRIYLTGITLEYRPELVVHHFHGRKKLEEAYALMRSYNMANGAMYVRYLFRHPILCRPFLRHLKNAVKEILMGKNHCWPEIGLTACDVVGFNLKGAVKYALMKIGIRYKS